MSKRLLLLPCLLIAAAFAFAACGSSDDDESKVEEVIETSATTTDPGDCEGLQTQQFMEQISRESGEAAVEACEEEAKGEEGADGVTVSAVEVDGSDATAEAALEGGSLDGQTVEVALVKDGDQWKMNEVVKFTDFDQPRLVDGLEAALSGSDETDPKLVSCFVEAFEQASTAEVEELMFGDSPKALEELFETCASSAGA